MCNWQGIKKMNYIKCRWLEKGRIVVNPDGQVHPCCYFANFNYIAKNTDPEGYRKNWDGTSNHSIMSEYEKDRDDLNVNNKSMKEILSHKWYSKSLPDSWKEQDTRHEICIRFCQHDE